MSCDFQIWICKCTLSECELGEMSSQKLVVINCTKWSIILCEPVVEWLSHIQRLQCHNEFLFKLYMLIDCAHSLLACVPPKLVNELEILRRLVSVHVWFLGITLRLHRKLLLLLLIGLLFEYFVIFSDDLGLKPATSVSWIIFNFDGKFNIWLDKHLNKARRFVLRLVDLTTVARWVHTACQPFLLLVAIIVRIVFNGLFFDYFIIISLFNNLTTFLLTRRKKVLNGNVVLRLNFDLLFVIENRYLVPTAIKCLKFRYFRPWVNFAALMYVLFGFLLVGVNEVMDVTIFVRQVLLFVMHRNKPLRIRHFVANSWLECVHCLLGPVVILVV